MSAVVKEPPFEVSESGYGSFTLPVQVHFINHETVEFQCRLRVYASGQISTCISEPYYFRNPSKSFREKLINAGGQPCQCGQKKKPKKRSSESAQPKSKKKKRLEKDIEMSSEQQPSSSRQKEHEKSPPLSMSSDTSSDDDSSDKEWRLSQASGYDQDQ